MFDEFLFIVSSQTLGVLDVINISIKIAVSVTSIY